MTNKAIRKETAIMTSSKLFNLTFLSGYPNSDIENITMLANMVHMDKTMATTMMAEVVRNRIHLKIVDGVLI